MFINGEVMNTLKIMPLMKLTIIIKKKKGIIFELNIIIFYNKYFFPIINIINII